MSTTVAAWEAGMTTVPLDEWNLEVLKPEYLDNKWVHSPYVIDASSAEEAALRLNSVFRAEGSGRPEDDVYEVIGEVEPGRWRVVLKFRDV